MKNQDINTIINEITPSKVATFHVVMETLFNSFREVNGNYLADNVQPKLMDELEFEDWFSWN